MTAPAGSIVVVLDDDPVRCAVYQCTIGTAAPTPGTTPYHLAFPRTLEAAAALCRSGRIEAVICARPLLTPEFRALAETLRGGVLAEAPWLTVEEAHDRLEDTERIDPQLLASGEIEIDLEEREPAPDLPFPFEEAQLRAVLARRARPPTPRPAVPTPAPTRGPTPAPARAPAPAPAQPAVDDPWRRFAARIGALFETLDKITYYQLLGVEDTADARVIQLAYEQRSLELHPDRFLQLSDEVLRERLYAIYKRVVEAFRVLDSPQRRAAYDANLANRSGVLRLVTTERPQRELARSPWEIARTQSGKTMLRSAFDALRAGQARKALQLFQAALQLEPDNAAIMERFEATKKLVGTQ